MYSFKRVFSTKPNTISKSFRFNEDTIKALEDLAKLTGAKSMNEALVMALDEYLQLLAEKGFISLPKDAAPMKMLVQSKPPKKKRVS